VIKMARPELVKPKNLNLETLIGLAKMLVAEETDGHLTLMQFTTGWKVFIRTPDLDTGSRREEIGNVKMHETLKEALIDLILHKGKGRGKYNPA